MKDTIWSKIKIGKSAFCVFLSKMPLGVLRKNPYFQLCQLQFYLTSRPSFLLFCFVLISNAFKQNPNLSKANKERISSSNWSGVSKVVMKHCMLRPVQCQRWMCIKMRRFIKLWAKRLAPSLYCLMYTSLFQQQTNRQIRLFIGAWR